MKKNKFYKRDVYFLLMIFPLTMICKIIQNLFLSGLTSTDSNYILYLMKNNVEKEGTAFYVTATIFSKLNIFNFSTLTEWACFLAVIFSIVFFVLLLRYKKIIFEEIVFIYISLILLNLYTFNLSKDIIQFTIFIIVFFIASSENIKDKIKITLIFIVFIFEAMFFRSYYVLIAYGFLLSVYILKKCLKNKTTNIKKIIVFAFLLFLIPIGISKSLIPNEYNKLVNVRDEITSVLKANTEINNIFPRNDFLGFVINYILNGIRILLPFELIIKNVKYLPFVIYQLYITIFILIKQIKNLKQENILYLAIIIGYFLGSIVYEPDFGSVVRHEITLILFFVALNYSRLDERRNRI